jgi:UDP-glucose 4-epimerase
VKALITGGRVSWAATSRRRSSPAGDTVYLLDNLSTGSIDNIEHLKSAPRFHYAVTA